MKSFRTEFALPAEPLLRTEQPILTLGSCFAEHIGQKLIASKWSGLNAPFGTLFHPLALSKLLRMAQDHADLDPQLFVEHDGAFFHHDLHSQFYARRPADLQMHWQELASSVRAVLREGPLVLLTLGTAWVYERKAGGQIVANCHKQPVDHFQKRLLSAAEIQQALQEILDILPAASPVMISLSPVRHIRDTMILNSVSKSLLRVQIHAWSESHPERVHYFPAYEIMLDDLRDYRFYEADHIHPSREAIDYIWDHFITAYATAETRTFLKRWTPILNALQHRPQRMDAPSYQKHLRSLLQDLEGFTGIDCARERDELRSRLLS